jgi:biopolymer transport protein ExbB
MYYILLAAGWPIWPLLAISILGLAILIERAWYLRKKHIIRKETIELAFNANARDAANSEFLSDLSASSPIGALLAGILREQALGHSAEAAIEELQILAQNLWAKLDRYLGGLATIATVAPLLGLFGTVIGMIEIFSSQGAGVTGTDNPVQLAQGISIALYNTAFGLMVAIPSLIFWRYFRGRIESYVLQMELATERFARHLNSLRQSP